jgi:hypothetical protein
MSVLENIHKKICGVKVSSTVDHPTLGLLPWTPFFKDRPDGPGVTFRKYSFFAEFEIWFSKDKFFCEEKKSRIHFLEYLRDEGIVMMEAPILSLASGIPENKAIMWVVLEIIQEAMPELFLPTEIK